MPQPVWTTPHELHIHRQTEAHRGDDGWLVVQGTDLIHLLCNCGYSTGWISRAELPTREQLLAEHGKPLQSLMTG